MALDSVSLVIERGTFVALMGPSGSGKSTLLNVLAGRDKPSTGTVLVGDVRLNELTETRLAKWRATHVGFVFQFYNLISVLSAAENVDLPLLLTRLSKPERRRHAQAALAAVGLRDRHAHLPSQLSGGEQQRVAIARAIVIDPQLIIADEPTGDLDAQNTDDLLVLLRRLNREYGKTIVMVTHDTRAEPYVDRIVKLDKGTLVGEHPGSAPRTT